MLTSFSTRRGTGIIIRGDYYDLSALHALVHALSNYFEHKPKQQPQFDLLIDFAYQLRKAKDGQREVLNTEAPGGYYGFQYTWPDMFVVSNLLRYAAGRMPTSSAEQLLLARLELIMIDALNEYDAAGAHQLTSFVGYGVHVDGAFLVHASRNMTFNYLRMGATKQRFKALPMILQDYLSPAGEAYQSLVAKVLIASNQHKCSIEEIEVTAFPDKFVW